MPSAKASLGSATQTQHASSGSKFEHELPPEQLWHCCGPDGGAVSSTAGGLAHAPLAPPSPVADDE
jgi:hypothetical protein